MKPITNDHHDPLECWCVVEIHDASPRQHWTHVMSIRYTIGELRNTAIYTRVILLASNRFEPDSFTVFDYRKYPYVEQKFNDLLTAQAFARMRV